MKPLIGLPAFAALVACVLLRAPALAADEAADFVRFEEEPAATCVSRSGMQVLVRSTHPTRTVRVWLDRYHMGVGTGDRSRSELRPGAEAEALGCSRSLTGTQEWRLVRAQFVD